MRIDRTALGCLRIEMPIFNDERGMFRELHKESVLPKIKFKQWNISYSKLNVVRGMHFQTNNPQGKLVRSVGGCIIDCVVDLRKGSLLYGQTENFILFKGGDAIYVPPGFAHGFWAYSGPEAVLLYACTEEYDPKSDGGINPLDPSLSFPWKDESRLIVSEKDKNLPFLKGFQSPFKNKDCHYDEF